MNVSVVVSGVLVGALAWPCFAQDVDLKNCTTGGEKLPSAACAAMELAMAEQAASEAATELRTAAAVQRAREREQAKIVAAEREAEQDRARAMERPRPTYRFEQPKPRGQNHWVWHEGVQFGYRKALSESDRRRGIVTAPLLLVAYHGKQGSTHRFVAMNPTVLMKCSDACENMSITSEAGPQVVPVAPGSVLWSIVQDARNGWFTFGPVFTSDPNYKSRD